MLLLERPIVGLYMLTAGAFGVAVRALVFSMIPLSLADYKVPLINTLGCVGIALYFVIFPSSRSESEQLILLTGFFGGLTTYSAMMMHVIKIIQEPSSLSNGLIFFLINLIMPLALGLAIYLLLSR